MAKYSEYELLKMTQEITVSAVGADCGGKLQAIQCADATAKFIQAVYDKLKEINDAISD